MRMSDLDFVSRQPARGAQPTVGVARASSVHEVVLTRIADDRRDAADDVRLEIQGDRDALGDSERRIRFRTLHLRDVAARDTDRLAELLLGQAESRPSLTGQARECDPKRHRASEGRWLSVFGVY